MPHGYKRSVRFYGAGIPVYLVQRGKALVILLCGGDKKSQSCDIRLARNLAADLEDDDQRELLIVAFASRDASYIKTALGTVARARGMGVIARDSGVSREALYKALSPSGDPPLSTLLGVIIALGLKIRTCPARTL